MVASDSLSLTSSVATAESLGEVNCTFVFGRNVKSVLTAYYLLFDVGHSTFKSFLQVSVVSNVFNTYSGGFYCIGTDFAALSIVIKDAVPMHFSEVSSSSCMSYL